MASEGKPGRAQGSADSKPGVKKPAPRGGHSPGARGGLSLDSEQSARLMIFSAVALVVIIAAGLLVFGYWYSVVRPRNRTVLRVENISVSYTAMKRRMAYEFLTNTNYQTQTGAQILPEATYQTLLNELTEITQAEGKLGITVDDATVDQQLRTRIGVAVAADQRTFADALRKELDKTGLTESELRRLVRTDTITSKIKDKYKAEVPAVLQQSKIEMISTQTEAAAKQAIDRINAGEDFATVAKAVSKEADVQTTGGLHDYGPQGSFNAAYDDYAFSGEIGKLSAPLSSGGTNAVFYVVRVVDRSDQPVKDSEKPTIADKQYADWLKNTQDELQSAGKITRAWEQQAQNDALNAVIAGAGPKLVAQKQKQQQDQQKAQDVRQTTVAQLTASPAVASTPVPGATAGASTPDQGQSSSPVAPSLPVAPGSNGQ
jgi:hypothetical protein